jgi:hypothetical protein
MRAGEILLDEVDIGGEGAVTGVLASFLANARAALDAGANPDEQAEAAVHLREDAAALDAMGVFELLEVRSPRLERLLGLKAIAVSNGSPAATAP